MQVKTIDEVDLKLRLFSSFEVCDLIAILGSIHQPIDYVVFFFSLLIFTKQQDLSWSMKIPTNVVFQLLYS